MDTYNYSLIYKNIHTYTLSKAKSGRNFNSLIQEKCIVNAKINGERQNSFVL